MKKILLLFVTVFVVFFTMNTVHAADEKTSMLIDNLSYHVSDDNLATIKFTLKADLEYAPSINLTNKDFFNLKTIQYVSEKESSLKKGTELVYTFQRDEEKLVQSEKAHGALEMIFISPNATNGYSESSWYQVDEKTEKVTLSQNSSYFFVDEAFVYTFNERYQDKYHAILWGGAENVAGFAIELTEHLAIPFAVDFSNFEDLENEKQVEWLINYVINSLKNEKELPIELVDFNIYNDRILDKTILEEIKSIKRPVSVNFGNYSWTFDGNQMDDFNANINLGVSVGYSVNQEKIESLVPDKEKSLVLEFGHDGALPKATHLKIDVDGRFDDGEILTLSYYNKDGKLEEIARDLVVKNSMVEFDLEHCSEYVLTKQIMVNEKNQETTNNVQTSSIDIFWYSSISFLSLAGMIYLICKRNI